jgi:hypothetical protein
MHDEDALVDKLAAEILTYLEAHPDAADSLDGIVQWWIVHERFLRGIAATGRALERLVDEGRMECITLADGSVIYRAASQAGTDSADASAP